MAEERKGAKIKKWDDVNGCPTEEVTVPNTSQATEGKFGRMIFHPLDTSF